jgi:uncharacterized protein YoxC
VAFYGDPDELDRLANALDSYAAQVRQITKDQLTTVRNAAWVSAAKQKYQDDLMGKCNSADQAAAGIQDAARILRAHAQEVRETVALIGRIEQKVTEWYAYARDQVDKAIQSGAAGAAAPWLSWPRQFQPGALPASGDKAWLDVGQFMQRAGVL